MPRRAGPPIRNYYYWWPPLAFSPFNHDIKPFINFKNPDKVKKFPIKRAPLIHFQVCTLGCWLSTAFFCFWVWGPGGPCWRVIQNLYRPRQPQSTAYSSSCCHCSCLTTLAWWLQGPCTTNFTFGITIKWVYLFCFIKSNYNFYRQNSILSQIPYLLWCTPFSIKLKLFLWGLIELAWNRYPSTDWSSAVLHLSHVTILIGLFMYLRDMKTEPKIKKKSWCLKNVKWNKDIF